MPHFLTEISHDHTTSRCPYSSVYFCTLLEQLRTVLYCTMPNRSPLQSRPHCLCGVCGRVNNVCGCGSNIRNRQISQLESEISQLKSDLMRLYNIVQRNTRRILVLYNVEQQNTQRILALEAWIANFEADQEIARLARQPPPRPPRTNSDHITRILVPHHTPPQLPPRRQLHQVTWEISAWELHL